MWVKWRRINLDRSLATSCRRIGYSEQHEITSLFQRGSSFDVFGYEVEAVRAVSTARIEIENLKRKCRLALVLPSKSIILTMKRKMNSTALGGQ